MKTPLSISMVDLAKAAATASHDADREARAKDIRPAGLIRAAARKVDALKAASSVVSLKKSARRASGG